MKLSNLTCDVLQNRSPMCELAKHFGTDKHDHGYTKIYHEIMKDKKEQNISILELGIYQGSSIKMWHDYFKHGLICGTDNGRIVKYSKIKSSGSCENPSKDDIELLKEGNVFNTDFSWLENQRIKCYTADQRSYEQMKNAFNHFGTDMFDYILDDGHHFQEHQQKSLGLLFPHVKSKGFYIIEDIVCANSLRGGMFWGQNKKDCTDSTDDVFTKFIEHNILESDYMTTEQRDYIVDNIEDIHLWSHGGHDKSPVTGSSKLLVIRKK